MSTCLKSYNQLSMKGLQRSKAVEASDTQVLMWKWETSEAGASIKSESVGYFLLVHRKLCDFANSRIMISNWLHENNLCLRYWYPWERKIKIGHTRKASFFSKESLREWLICCSLTAFPLKKIQTFLFLRLQTIQTQLQTICFSQT